MSRDVPEDAENLELPPIEAAPSKILAGRLIDENDQPVANAQIIGIYQNWVCARATSEDDGTFKFPRMPTEIEPDEATYRVSISVGKSRDRYDGVVEPDQEKTFTIRINR